MGRLAVERTDAQLVGYHCRKLCGRVLAGAFVDNVCGQTRHWRVIEAHGKDVFVLFVDHAAQGRPSFESRPSLLYIGSGNKHHHIGALSGECFIELLRAAPAPKAHLFEAVVEYSDFPFFEMASHLFNVIALVTSK